MRHLPRQLHFISFAIICFIILSSPLLLGSNRLLPWIINATLTAIAFALWLVSRLLNKRLISLPAKRFVWPISVLILALIWTAIQWLPLDMDNLAHPIWAFAEKLNKIDLVSRITADYRLTEQAGLRLATFALFAWLIVQFAADPKRAKSLLTIFIASALFYAAYGLWAHTQGSDTILWMGKRLTAKGLSSTFVNRNHAATYFGLASLVSFILMMQAYREIFVHHRRQHSFADWLIDLLASRIGLLLLAFILFLGCVLLTQSRAGILSTGIALAFAAILQTLLANRSKQNSNGGATRFRRVFLALFAGLSIAGYIALQLSGDAFLTRLSDTSSNPVYRLELYRLCLEMIKDFPLLGTGYGSFQTAFIFYQDETLPNTVFWDKAHNSYLEVLIGLGLPVGLALLSAFGWAVMRCRKAFIYRQRNRYFSVLGLSSTLLIGLHSLADFSMQIQAITFAYLVIIGAAVAQSWSSRSPAGPRK